MLFLSVCIIRRSCVNSENVSFFCISRNKKRILVSTVGETATKYFVCPIRTPVLQAIKFGYVFKLIA